MKRSVAFLFVVGFASALLQAETKENIRTMSMEQDIQPQEDCVAQTPFAYYNVKSFGAVGDGRTIDQEAINKAIDAAAKAGGGTVYFPAGKYASYSIRLKDNICLYLDMGAVLMAAAETQTAKYDAPEPNEYKGKNNAFQDFGHSHWQNSLIWGIGLNNIAIAGFGMIDGSAGLTRGERGGANKAVALKNCRNVSIKDITVYMGGHFAFLLSGVDNMTLENIKVDSNRDGFDIDCCRNVRMSDCTVNCLQDDAIVLKSSFCLGELRPCENITITNCQVTGYDMGTYLDGTYGTKQSLAPDRDGPTGRIKLGTESNAAFRNITISNCVFKRSRGIALETVDGAVIEDVSISNITMEDICNSVIFLRIGNRARGPEELISHSLMRRISISNVVAYNVDSRYSMLIAGLPGHPIEDVSLSNIRIFYKGGLSLRSAAEQKNGNTFFQRNVPGASGERHPYDVPECEKAYPEPSCFGILPASAMYIRHAKNVNINNVQIAYIEEDTRPAIVLSDVDGIRFTDLCIQKPERVPYFVLKEVNDFSTFNVAGFADVQERRVGSRQKEL